MLYPLRVVVNWCGLDLQEEIALLHFTDLVRFYPFSKARGRVPLCSHSSDHVLPFNLAGSSEAKNRWEPVQVPIVWQASASPSHTGTGTVHQPPLWPGLLHQMQQWVPRVARVQQRAGQEVPDGQHGGHEKKQKKPPETVALQSHASRM